MLEYLAPGRQSHYLGRSDVFLLPQRQDLPSHQPRDAAPTEYRYDDHQHVDLLIRRQIPGVDHRGSDEQDRQRRNTVEHIHDPHDHLIDPAAEISCQPAKHDADDGFENDDDKPDQKGNPSAVHEPYEHVHAEVIGAEQVSRARRRILVGIAHEIDDFDDGDLLAVLADIGVLRLDRRMGRRIVDLRFPPPLIDDRSEKGKEEQKRDHNDSDDRKLGTEETAHDQPHGADLFISRLFLLRFRRVRLRRYGDRFFRNFFVFQIFHTDLPFIFRV